MKILIEKLERKGLKEFNLLIQDVNIRIAFFQVILGDTQDQKLLRYDLFLSKKDKIYSQENIPIYNDKIELIALKNLKQEMGFWFSHLGSFSALDYHVHLIGDIRLSIKNEYEGIKFYIYLSEEEEFEIQPELDLFDNFLKVSLTINDYVRKFQ